MKLDPVTGKLAGRYTLAAIHLTTMLDQNSHGPIAQLGERLARIQEVRGSSPLRSTIEKSPYRAFFLYKKMFYNNLTKKK